MSSSNSTSGFSLAVPTNMSLYTGAVCMSLQTVGNTTYLPLSDPFCTTSSCLAFAAAKKASQASASWAAQFNYGHYTTWYYLATVGAGVALNVLSLYKNKRSVAAAPAAAARPSVFQKLQAIARYALYRRVRGRPVLHIVFSVFTLAFFMLLAFWERPYYRARRGYGSPPLAVRSGLMATALLPLVVALGGKVNVVTMLTGVSHEKLNVVHRWGSYMLLALALMHVIPFFYSALSQCGSAGLYAETYENPGSMVFSGIPTVSMLIGLALLSIPYIRRNFYNFFFRTHIPMYFTFLGLMFWHTGATGDSWDYLWATLALYMVSVGYRFFSKWQTVNPQRVGFSGRPTRLTPLSNGMTRLTISAPSDLTWSPGQHFWLRIPAVSMLQNHPYTAASLPGPSVLGAQDMTFLVRAQKGLTRQLRGHAVSHPEVLVSAHLDGPYGGVHADYARLYERLVFVAGGSGVAACVPHVLHAARKMHEGGSTVMVRSVDLIWIVNDKECVEWVRRELEEIKALGGAAIRVHVYVTRGDGGDDSDDERSLDEEKSMDEEKSIRETTVAMHYEKPVLDTVLRPMWTTQRTFVFGCGPLGLTNDLSNSVADAQFDVLNGKATTITLSAETFGW